MAILTLLWTALPAFAAGLLVSFFLLRRFNQNVPAIIDQGATVPPLLPPSPHAALSPQRAALAITVLVACTLFPGENARTPPLFTGLYASGAASANSKREPRHASQLERLLHQHDAAPAYSSFRCTGGAQRFQKFADEDVATRDLRICVFSNVCLINRQLTYFVSAAERSDPTEMRLEGQGSESSPPGFLWAGTWSRFIHGTALQIKFEETSIPGRLERAENNRVYFLSELSLPSNYGHLLLDNVVPTYATAEILGIDVRDVQLIGLKSCIESEVHMWTGWNLKGVRGVSAEKDPQQLCQESMARWLPLLLEHPYDDLGRDRCFGTLVAGHEGMFASHTFVHRASAMRSMRQRLLHSLGLPDVLPREHRVLVLQQQNYIQGFGSLPYIALCENATSAMRGLSARVEVQCIRPAELSVDEQMRQILRSTLVITVHGTTSYSASMFACPGTSLLIAFSDAEGAPKIKEARTTLFAIDLQVFHAPFSTLQAGNWAPYLLLALRRAGERFGIA